MDRKMGDGSTSEASMTDQNAIGGGLDARAQELVLLMKADEERRVRACTAEIQAVLAKYVCELEPVISIVGTRVASDIRVTAKPVGAVPSR